MLSQPLKPPQIDFKPGSTSKTPFERILLPGFARWFVAQLDDEPYPDFFIPVETKGARLLDAVVAYAREELGTPLRVPVLYRPALAYLDPAKGTGKSVVILDDATRTGGTLSRHRDAVRRWGEQHVTSLACVGDAGPTGDQQVDPERSVRCWMQVPSSQYHEVLWQLAQLVVARGLPPEVDHHVFRVDVRSRLSRAWQQIGELLDGYGTLTHDGRLTEHGDIFSMTLHWPELPGQPDYPKVGPVRDEGVRKVRLFADFAQDTIHVVPMAFPALDVPGGDDAAEVSLETCQAIAAKWTDGRSTVAQMLIERAHQRTPETLYRALGTAAEFDLVTSLAGLLGWRAHGQVASISAERDVFSRLYGPQVGGHLADRIDPILIAALDSPNPSGPAPLRTNGAMPTTFDHEDANDRQRVKQTTESIVTSLKSGYKEEVERRATHLGARFGLSLTEIAERAGVDELTLSRAIDHGLAVTSLVPYTDVSVTDRHVRVRRKYRASEQTRLNEDGQLEDLESHNRQTDEETIGLVLRTLRRRSSRWHNSPIPGHHLAKIVAVLEGLVLGNEQITLCTRPSEFGPDLALGQPSEADGLRAVTSEHFQPEGDGFVESDLFDESYGRGELRLQQRGAAGPIENYLREIVRVLDDAPNVSDLLMCWSASSAGRLGLDFVRHDLELALKALDRPLRILKRDSAIDPARLAASVTRARHLAGVARSKVTALSSDWASPVRQAFSDPLTLESDLLRSTAAPSDRGQLMAVADGLCRATERLADLVSRLEVFAPEDPQAQLIAEPVDPEGAAEKILADAHELLAKMSSLREAGSLPHLPEDPKRRRQGLATHLERVLLAVRAQAAAFAWSFLGVPQFQLDRPETRRRTILFADLSGSTPAGFLLGQQAHVKWKNSGLNLLAQWGRAFGGIEVKDREGDDVVMEFVDPDAAVLCAALIQEHTRVLRSVELPEVRWAFRVALDTDEITSADGGNVIGNAVNRAAKLAKINKDDHESVERVLITPETVAVVCPQMRDLATEQEYEVDLAADENLPVKVDKAKFHPWSIDLPELLTRHAARLRGG